FLLTFVCFRVAPVRFSLSLTRLTVFGSYALAVVSLRLAVSFEVRTQRRVHIVRIELRVLIVAVLARLPAAATQRGSTVIIEFRHTLIKVGTVEIIATTRCFTTRRRCFGRTFSGSRHRIPR